MAKRKSKNYEKFAKTVISKLKKEGVECYLWHAATTGSAYIRFDDNRIGSVRLGDHKGRSQYGYKWNIRSDFPTGHSRWHKVNNMWRYYVHAGNWADIVPHIVEQSNKVAKWGPSKYGGYYIPEHKKKENGG